MGAAFRILLALAIFAGLHQIPAVRGFEQQVLESPLIAKAILTMRDASDKRPEVSVLFIGNSRTFVNDLPSMIRRVADSASDPRRFHMEMYAVGGRSMKDHWDDPKVRDLLRRKWDFVVLQGGSSEQTTPYMEASFYTYCSQLVMMAKQDGAVPVLYVAWRPLPGAYPGLPDIPPAALYQKIQAGYALVARNTGAKLVNVGKAFETVMARSREPLMSDGNHPTPQGTYLAALMFYRFLSNNDLDHVAYVPAGLSDDEVTLLKQAAMEK